MRDCFQFATGTGGEQEVITAGGEFGSNGFADSLGGPGDEGEGAGLIRHFLRAGC